MIDYPVIAAVKNTEEFKQAIASSVKAIFHLTPNILTLKRETEAAHNA